ncbi:radical SAM family heme chaperone HemW [Agilicoccus flavus]|uniref:radical SAM family heme chaperone HemW n=1 Tax=Agilicoccus flavus TaxID=2775968 RepID=UPI001CF60A9A|nr:radical SAM family heme chaperone HemW [Agilicoccus flavus]
MPRLPDGDPAPADGALDAQALAGLAGVPFGMYLHVPFCATRCGYCDFNTYTPRELLAPTRATPGATDPRAGLPSLVASYTDAARAEIDLAARVLGADAPVVDTIFVGGGTPTLLPTAELTGLVGAVRDTFGLRPDAEVTTEANPDSVDEASLAALAEGGITRVSLGMQSAVPHVLGVLDRTHDPANVARAVRGARAAGLAVSLDLIYGTPGESLQDWRASLEAVLALEPDHVSAYALVVEEGTALAARVRRGAVPAPSDDDEADKYELADELLGAAGYDWYEVSNFTRTSRGRCRHNEGYWAGGNWWGIGPGAHGHVGGVRWWNVKHPARYASMLAAGDSPAAGREALTPEQRHDERVLLGVRLADGLPLSDLDARGRAAVAGLVADGLLDPGAALGGRPAREGGEAQRRAVLTLRGRLLADTVVRALLGF